MKAYSSFLSVQSYCRLLLWSGKIQVLPIDLVIISSHSQLSPEPTLGWGADKTEVTMRRGQLSTLLSLSPCPLQECTAHGRLGSGVALCVPERRMGLQGGAPSWGSFLRHAGTLSRESSFWIWLSSLSSFNTPSFLILYTPRAGETHTLPSCTWRSFHDRNKDGRRGAPKRQKAQVLTKTSENQTEARAESGTAFTGNKGQGGTQVRKGFLPLFCSQNLRSSQQHDSRERPA